MKATSDYGALTTSVANFQWSQNFKELASVWGFPLVLVVILFLGLLLEGGHGIGGSMLVGPNDPRWFGGIGGDPAFPGGLP
ncbi:hypothetical protein JHK82_039995 [Glycine max]|nr:hypothetical protein JHK82_039995 [Glycine max]KAG5122068.1 hypothetical protein JHK84_040408 [Glycine max]